MVLALLSHLFWYMQPHGIGWFANILLGISQGLTWSSTMKMIWLEKRSWTGDGTQRVCGYFAVSSFYQAILLKNMELPLPFLSRIGISIIGFLLTLFLSKTPAYLYRRRYIQ
jgi:hypothetical protein